MPLIDQIKWFCFGTAMALSVGIAEPVKADQTTMGTMGTTEENVSMQDCTSDEALRAKGFQVQRVSQTQRFAQRVSFVQDKLSSSNQNIVFDTRGTVFSRPSNRTLIVTSYDDLRTPSMEMYGDYLVIEDFETGEVAELRWYKNGKKYVAYNASQLLCAVNLLPFAENALF